MRITVLICIAYSLTSSRLGAQSKPVTIEQINSAWQMRQDKIQNARFELDLRETNHKGLVSRASGSKNLDPPDDINAIGTGVLVIEASNLRYESNVPSWSSSAQKIYDQKYTSVFDGKTYTSLTQPASNDQSYPLAHIQFTKTSNENRRFSLLPIYASVRGRDVNFVPDLSKYQISEKLVSVKGQDCIELVLRKYNAQELIYLSLDKGYSLVRNSIMQNDAVMWQIDVSYIKDDLLDWSPASWEYFTRAGKDRALVQSGKYTISSRTYNSPLSTGSFEIALPVGTRVIDNRPKKQEQFIFLESGKEGVHIESSLHPLYQELQSQESEKDNEQIESSKSPPHQQVQTTDTSNNRNGIIYLIAGITTFAIVFVAIRFLLKRARSKRPNAEPSFFD